MLRHFDPAFLSKTIPDYDRMIKGADSYSSIWLEVG
jgi:hypothetical protein